jgi:hypothetical protein
LEAFPIEERELWRDAREHPHELREVPAARQWLVGASLPHGEVLAAEGAFSRSVDGRLLVCPWRTRLRMLAGLLAFRGSVPEEVAEAFVPEREARRAAHELAVLGENHPEVRSHILHANWHVPLRWFAAFDDTERILTEDKNGLRIRYETNLADARARLERAVAILETSWIDESVRDAVRELLGWLEGFVEDGLVELDYSSVAGVFGDEELIDDHSAAEVWACLEALVESDVVRAGRTFGTLSERWTEVRAHEVLN